MDRITLGIVGVIMLVTMVAQTYTAFELDVRPREESGTIQSLDFQARRLTINLGCGDKTLTRQKSW